MFSKNPEHLRFTEALVGLIFEPMSTARSLLGDRRWGVLFGILAIFFFCVFAPAVVEEAIDLQPWQGLATLVALFLIFWVALFTFVLLETLLLLLLGGNPTFGKVFAIAIFALIPLSLCALLIFATDYLMNNTFRTAFFLTRGEQWFSNSFATILKYCIVITQFVTAFCFFCYLRVMASMGVINALFTTVISILPLYISLAAGALFTRFICPSCIEKLFAVLMSFFGTSKFF